jgi:DNA (cytosine-5)-methyltransferase 1
MGQTQFQKVILPRTSVRGNRNPDQLRGCIVKLASFFSGAGGLDRGFENAGFEVVYANEYDRTIWATYEHNFPRTKLDRRSIVDIEVEEVPACDGMIGGPPCQSWSEAGSLRGIEDARGQLFFEYIRILEAKRPLFFLAENVSGILFNRHRGAFESILEHFSELGYNVSYGLLNANDYGVPQDRDRVIIVGYLAQTGMFFQPPDVVKTRPTLEVIRDLAKTAKPAAEKNYANKKLKVPNHEYMTGGFSTIFMSRNRVRPYNMPSYTIQAGGRHAPLHPQAPEMVVVGKDKRAFVEGAEHLYRRLSVRECARVQTFPDNHLFLYSKVADGYKMVGNAVPVTFAEHLANKIKVDLKDMFRIDRTEVLSGSIAGPDFRFGPYKGNLLNQIS